MKIVPKYLGLEWKLQNCYSFSALERELGLNDEMNSDLVIKKNKKSDWDLQQARMLINLFKAQLTIKEETESELNDIIINLKIPELCPELAQLDLKVVNLISVNNIEEQPESQR